MRNLSPYILMMCGLLLVVHVLWPANRKPRAVKTLLLVVALNGIAWGAVDLLGDRSATLARTPQPANSASEAYLIGHIDWNGDEFSGLRASFPAPRKHAKRPLIEGHGWKRNNSSTAGAPAAEGFFPSLANTLVRFATDPTARKFLF